MRTPTIVVTASLTIAIAIVASLLIVTQMHGDTPLPDRPPSPAADSHDHL
jgi:hypothetical protein